MKAKNPHGILRSYLVWPLILIPVVLAMTIHMYFSDFHSGLIATCYLAGYVLISLLIYYFKRPAIISNVVNYALDYNRIQKYLLRELCIPYANLDHSGNILWANDLFTGIIGTTACVGKPVFSFFPEITPGAFPVIDPELNENNNEAETVNEKTFVYKERYYRAVVKRLNIHEFDFANDEENIALFKGSDVLCALYLYDETEIHEYIAKIDERDIVMGLLYIDNYEESLANCDEIQRSLLMALVERQIAKTMTIADGIYRKMEKDRYFFIFQKQYLTGIMDSKFAILNEVRNVTVGNSDAHVTVSIGIGLGADTYAKRYEYARTAIDLALGRGGDQAVVKNGENLYYFGGGSVQKESNTRVRARVKAHALNELIVAAEQIFIMGHSNCDIDSFGAAIGIFRIARALERKAHIVLDKEDCPSILNVLDRYTSNSYYKELLIDSSEALRRINAATLLIIVDVNLAHITQCPELLEHTANVVVIDHHRQTGKRIENQVLSYIEPFASSASEMVTELLQYIGDGVRPKPLEADTMYSGIMVDTNNFTVQTNVRTFEAVAYLKRNGADITRIRKMFRSDPLEYKLRAQAISNVEIYHDSYAITIIPMEDKTKNYSVIGAKVANSLLDMDNIKASFALSEYKSLVYISARSIDEVNVQLIMEKLGGGGHLSVAAAQVDSSIEDAVRDLKNVIDEMIKEGDIK